MEEERRMQGFPVDHEEKDLALSSRIFWKGILVGLWALPRVNFKSVEQIPVISLGAESGLY